jgi:hypothetical protein
MRIDENRISSSTPTVVATVRSNFSPTGFCSHHLSPIVHDTSSPQMYSTPPRMKSDHYFFGLDTFRNDTGGNAPPHFHRCNDVRLQYVHYAVTHKRKWRYPLTGSTCQITLPTELWWAIATQLIVHMRRVRCATMSRPRVSEPEMIRPKKSKPSSFVPVQYSTRPKIQFPHMLAIC